MTFRPFFLLSCFFVFLIPTTLSRRPNQRHNSTILFSFSFSVTSLSGMFPPCCKTLSDATTMFTKYNDLCIRSNAKMES